MKRWLIVIAAVGALALILAGGSLLGHSRSTSAADPTVTLSSYPGNPDSGVTASVTFMDIVTPYPYVTSGTALASWTVPPAYSNVATFFYSGQNCDPVERVAILVMNPGTTKDIFLTNGVQFGALGANTLLIDENTHAAYPGGAATVNSVGMATLPGYPDALDYAKIQYLACGNVDGSAVTGWDGLLNEDETFISPPYWLTAFEIDKVKDPGPDGDLGTADDTWCDPVDNEAEVDTGGTEQVAICLSNALKAPASFNFDLLYDDSLNVCSPDIACTTGTCMDDNPDANGDASLSGATFWTTPDLGAGYDCGNKTLQPVCDKIPLETGPGKGDAYMSCTTTDVPTLPHGMGVSAPLAVVSFDVKPGAGGTDTLKLVSTAAFAADFTEIASCYLDEDGNPISPFPCYDAVDNKVPPPPATETPTPTATPPPTLTPTPTEVPPGVRMEKDANILKAGVQTVNNLWLMKPSLGCVNAAEGKGCLEVDKWVFAYVDADSPNDSDTIPEGLGTWEEQIKYDHKIVRLTPVPDVTWLQSGGRIAICTMTIWTENWMESACVTKAVNQCLDALDAHEDSPADGYVNDGCPAVGAPESGGQCDLSADDDLDGVVNDGCPAVGKAESIVGLGPSGSGLIEKIFVIPQTNDMIYRDFFRPTKDNGVVTDLVDENCEVADIYSEYEVPPLDPGGLTPVCGDAHITVRMLEGDLNLDCVVSVLDDQAIAFRYGAAWGMQIYDQWYDLEPKWSDFDVDIKDLQFVFGRNYSTCQAPIPDDQAIPVQPPQP